MEKKTCDIGFARLFEEAELAINDKNRMVKDSFVAHEQIKIIESFNKNDEEYTKQIVATMFETQFILKARYVEVNPLVKIPNRLFAPLSYMLYEKITEIKENNSPKRRKQNHPEWIYMQACKYQQLLEKEIGDKEDIPDERLQYLKSLNLMLLYLKEKLVNIV